MGNKKERSKPDVLHKYPQPDGSMLTEKSSWEEAFGELHPSQQILLEHNFLHNNFLMAESDRAVAVLAPAFIDAILHDLLRSVLVAGKSTDNLLSDQRPLSTFSAKIDMVHALGLIKDDAWHDLHLLRKIRNDFAHNIDAHTFDFEPVQNRCSEFLLQKRWSKPVNTTDCQSTRHKFLFVAWALVSDIAQALNKNAKDSNKSEPVS